MEEKKQDFKIDIINFARSITPMPVEVKQGQSDDKYVKFGEDNLYPHFLLQLFHESSLHNGIIKTKVNHIMGDGMVIKSSGKKAEYSINDVDSLEEIVRKITIDYLIFGWFNLEIQYNVFGEPISFNHLPAHHLRANESLTKYWVCKDWSLKRNVLTYDRWRKGLNEDGKSKIFMYSRYAPSVNNVYPIAEYNAATTNMLTEILIKDFNKNNIEDGFTPTHLISFFKGIPTADQAKELERKFDANFKGTNAKRYVLNHNELGSEQGVKIDTIGATNYAAALTEVRNTDIESILTVHQATSRILFAIESPGSLGDKSAMESSYQLFKGLFVKDTRNVIESGLNKILKDFGLEDIEFKDKSKLFIDELSDATREKVLTIDELRAIDNRPALNNGEGAKLISSVTPLPTFSIANGTGSKFSFNSDDTYKYGRILTEEDFEQVKHLGYAKSDYTSISETKFHAHSTLEIDQMVVKFDDEKDVDNYLLENEINGKKLSDIKADIRKELGITVTTDNLETRIKALSDAKVITSEVEDGKVKIAPVEPEKRKQVEVLYEYKVKAGYGDPIIPTSRGFCVKLIENDRLYSRSDIQQMSTLLGYGYSIWLHCGGWYFNPNTQKSENQCRHEWSKVSVIRKGAKA